MVVPAAPALAANLVGAPPGLDTNGSAERLELSETVQQAVLRDVDEKVEEMVKELWQKGLQKLNQLQLKQQEKVDKLIEEVSRCLQRQRELEAQNEHFKQVISEMASCLAAIGTAVNPGSALDCLGEGHTASETTTAGNSCATSISPPPRRRSKPAKSFTPVRGRDADAAFTAPLPEVPPFPFPAVAPLSLAEALGAGSPEKHADPPHAQQLPAAPGHQDPLQMQQSPTLLSLASSLPQGPPMEAPPMEAFGNGTSTDPVVFSFQIRKADETELGLNVTQDDTDHVLNIEGVRPEGAIGAWNRQCLGGAFPEKAVRPGDIIIQVNNVMFEPEKMLEECKERQLLKLTIVRGGLAHADSAALATQPGAGAGTTTTSLRADASEFVPWSATTTASLKATGTA